MGFFNFFKHHSGQAVIEYLLVVIFMTLLAIAMVKSFNEVMNQTVGSLSVSITKELSTGVCSKNCYYPGYFNGQGE